MKGKSKSIIRNISDFLKNQNTKTLSNLKTQPIKLIKRNSKSNLKQNNNNSKSKKRKYKSNKHKYKSNKSKLNVKKRPGFLPPQINNPKRGSILRKK